MQSLKTEPTDFNYDIEGVESQKSYVTTKEKTIYGKSPFYKLFSKIMKTLENSNVSSTKKNPYYIKGLSQHYLKKFMYNVPFWTNIMGSLLGFSHSSNQTAEAFFKVFKFNMCKNQKYIRIAEFIELLMTQTNMANFDSEIQNHGAVANKKKYDKIEELEKEKWSKKKKTQHSYYMGKELKKTIENL